jgi:tryptophanyl-tRNA synthetase
MQNSLQTLALYIACGVDPHKSFIFLQSSIKEHSEFLWILSCITPMSWLNRMTQYKDNKYKKLNLINCGLFTYPILMASDILLYSSNIIPVGIDQKQHIELTCKIAERFNSIFGKTLEVPKVYINSKKLKIMGLDDPSRKMSKSTGEIRSNHIISLLDSEEKLKKTIMSAKTDSGEIISFEKSSNGVKNLLNIYKNISLKTKKDIINEFTDKKYSFLKKRVFESMYSFLKPIQKEYYKLMKDKIYLCNILFKNIEFVQEKAYDTMNKIKEKLKYLDLKKFS